MTTSTSIFLPAANTLSITTDAVSSGYIAVVAADGIPNSYTTIDVSSTVTVGPFSNPFNYRVVADKGTLTPVITANIDAEAEAVPVATITTAGIASFPNAQFSVDGAGAVTIDDATTTTKGVASFADADFTVTAGVVTIDDKFLLNSGGDSGVGSYNFSSLSANATLTMPQSSTFSPSGIGQIGLDNTFTGLADGVILSRLNNSVTHAVISTPVAQVTSLTTPKILRYDPATDYFAVVDPDQSVVEAASGDGAITSTSGVVNITKTSAAALTLAAPAAADDGKRLIISSTTDFAHTVTATNLINDGVIGGAKDTATFGAYAGATITLLALGQKWNVVSLNAVLVTGA